MFSFVENRFRFYGVAIALVIFSLLSPWIFGTNKGIDMTGGIQIEYAVSGDRDAALAKAREIALALQGETKVGNTAVVNGTTTYGIAGTDSFIVEAGFSKGENMKDVDLETAKTNFTKNLTEKLTGLLGTQISQSRYVNVGESFGAYIKKSGYITLTMAIVMIAIYIAYAFRGSIPGMPSWPFTLVT